MEKNEIEVGDYVRRIDGIIGIVENKQGNAIRINFKKSTDVCNFLKIIINQKNIDDDERFKKHSKRIIDLIEEGDFVNGERIDHIIELPVKGKEEKHLFYNTETPIEEYNSYIFREHDIKTILTHEQYEQDCFRLEE